MKILVNFVICCLIIFSCASSYNQLRNVDEAVDISTIRTDETVTINNAGEILESYSIDIEIPNPLFGESSSVMRRADMNHQSTIICRIMLLDELSTKADILIQCLKDSLEEKSCEEFRKSYFEKHVRDGMFRIRISMESGFSKKSMEPEHWALYIENARGIMIESEEIISTEITAVQDSVFSEYNRINIRMDLFRRDITLYFKRLTFFGEDLLSEENPYIVFVISHKKKTLARIAWNISGEKDQLKIKRKPETIKSKPELIE